MLTYYPDQLDSYFSFDASDAIIEAVRTGSVEGLLQPALRLQQAIPSDRWSSFLRNHDQTRTLTAIEGDVANAKLAATLLLTMPGLPFVYYGEEIGMVGDKPDPRLRTPMQWSAANGAGFTTGTVWEPLQENWQTVNVEAQESDPGSLLNLYRRLIYLRAEHPALGAGKLVPLSAGRDDVAAYVRRGGDRSVLVIANLGDTQLFGVTVRSVDGMLPAGRYAATGLLGGPDGAEFEVGGAGRIEGYVPVPSLGPTQGYLFELTRLAG
jgi:alpha-amylase